MKKVLHIIISIVYIIWGIGAPLTLIKSLASLDLASLASIGTLISVATGLVMLFAGIFGLLRIKPLKRRLLGIFIFVLALAGGVGMHSRQDGRCTESCRESEYRTQAYTSLFVLYPLYRETSPVSTVSNKKVPPSPKGKRYFALTRRCKPKP